MSCWRQIALLGAALALWGCGPRNEFVAPPPPQVTVARPLERPVQEYFQTTGQTRAVASVDLRAHVGGYLKKVLFKDGQLVSEGDQLFVIDQAPYEAAVASSQANLEKAQAQLKLAEEQLARTQTLVKQNAETQSALDTQQAERDVAAAEVAAARAALRESQLNLQYTEIRAPFSGRMGRHLVDIGNLIIAGQTSLANVETVDPIYAYFNVSETDLLHFMGMQKEGRLTISEADLPKLDLAIGESEDFTFHGRLDYRQFGIDPSTGTTERRAVFPNRDAELVPGLFVRLRAAVGPPRPMLLVDERAVGSDQRGDYLLVVNAEEVVETRIVKLGQVQEGLRAIVTGIEPDDLVIINGLQRARPGSKVSPTVSEMTAAGAPPPPASAEEQPASQPSPPAHNAT